jgi:hypothetical protein
LPLPPFLAGDPFLPRTDVAEQLYNAYEGVGWCEGGPNTGVGTPTDPTDLAGCWAKCLELYPDSLVAADFWPLVHLAPGAADWGGVQCYCQTACTSISTEFLTEENGPCHLALLKGTDVPYPADSCGAHAWGRDQDGTSKCGPAIPYDEGDPHLLETIADDAESCCKRDWTILPDKVVVESDCAPQSGEFSTASCKAACGDSCVAIVFGEANGQCFTCSDDGRFGSGRLVDNSGGYSVYQKPVRDEVITGGGGWVQGWRIIFRQSSSSSNPFLLPTDAWLSYNADDTEGPNFSALDTLESCRNEHDGKLHLKLVWPEKTGANYNEWKQSSNPLTDGPYVDGQSEVNGYEALDITFTGGQWGGLERSGNWNGAIPSVLDGCIESSGQCWWFAIGANQVFDSGIPGPAESLTVVELYAMCPADGLSTWLPVAREPATDSGIDHNAAMELVKTWYDQGGPIGSETGWAYTMHPVEAFRNKCEEPAPKYEYVGCFKDNVENQRDMTGAHVMATVVGTETLPVTYSPAAYAPQIPVGQIADECATYCRELGFRYMGLQVSQP